jgi:hypothetical protein
MRFDDRNGDKPRLRRKWSSKGVDSSLLANGENLDDKGSVRLRALQEINKNITTAYFLKEQFWVVHTDRYLGCAKKALLQ